MGGPILPERGPKSEIPFAFGVCILSQLNTASLGPFCTFLALLGYLWCWDQVKKHYGDLLMYTNNFPLDIIDVEVQN